MPRHLPYHNYVGPGTDDFNKEPVDQDDAIALEHDTAYERARSSQDIYKADKEARNLFFNDFISNSNAHSLLGALGLGVKNVVEENLLQKPIYGGMPTPKNWAAIRQINKARQASIKGKGVGKKSKPPRENLDDFVLRDEDIPQAVRHHFQSPVKGSEAGPSGAQPTSGEQLEEPPTKMSRTEEAMDTQTAEASETGGSVDTRSGGAAPGGSGIGGGGENISTIFAGAPQQNNWNTLSYSKSYHFTLGNGLPQWRTQGGPMAQDVTRAAMIRYQNIHGIPWECLGMYLSEGEIARLLRFHSYVEVESVHCELYSLGVRLPFVTAATTSVTANANAQYPIGKFHFDEHYPILYDTDAIVQIINRCWGSQFYQSNITATTDWSSNFPNLTASTASRDIYNPPIYRIHQQLTNQDNYPKDPGIYDYVDIKNSTTAYGKCWEMHYEPKSILIANSMLQGYNAAGTQVLQNVEIDYAFLNQHDLSSIISPNRITPHNIEGNAVRWNNANRFRANEFTIQRIAQTPMVDYMIRPLNLMKGTAQHMPKFMVGFVNIRNADNSLLEGKWDIMVRCHIKLKVGEACMGFINRTLCPPPFYMNPYIQYGSAPTGVMHPAEHNYTLPSGRMALNNSTIRPSSTEEELLEDQLKHKYQHKNYLQEEAKVKLRELRRSKRLSNKSVIVDSTT